MEKKINIAELLKDCPKGMELDCAMYDNLYFDCICEHKIYPIVCYTIDSKGEKNKTSFNWYGKHTPIDTAKCVIFPKGKTTWEGFVPPCKFKDGDIVYIKTIGYTHNELIIIFKEIKNDHIHKHVCFAYQVLYTGLNAVCHLVDVEIMRLATEEEKEKLFQAIKNDGYKWNPETKTLDKFVEHKFNDGDIITDSLGTCIFKGELEGEFEGCVNYYCGISNGCFSIKDDKRNPSGHYGFIVNYRLSTEEEKQQLFDAIKANGYQWNAETKTLDKLPKFKVGDRIKQIGSPHCYIIKTIEFDRYILNNNQFIRFVDEHIYELVPNKFDITTLKPFDKVLARCSSLEKWRIQLFEKYDKTCKYPFICMGYNKYKECIPYEQNEHLLDTTDDCDEYYKTW